MIKQPPMEVFTRELTDKDFLLYKNNYLKKLEDALAEATRANGGAAWLGDFQEPLYHLIRAQFDSKVFLPHSYYNTARFWHHYHQGEKPTISEFIASEDREKELKQDLSSRVKAVLNKVSKNPANFEVSEVQAFFRDYHALCAEDSTEFLLPAIASSELSGPRILAVYQKLYSRRMVSRERDRPQFPGIGHTELFEKFTAGKLAEELELIRKGEGKQEWEHKWELRGIESFCEALQRQFRVLINSSQLIYTSKEAARRLIEEYTLAKAQIRKKVQIQMKI